MIGKKLKNTLLTTTAALAIIAGSIPQKAHAVLTDKDLTSFQRAAYSIRKAQAQDFTNRLGLDMESGDSAIRFAIAAAIPLTDAEFHQNEKHKTRAERHIFTKGQLRAISDRLGIITQTIPEAALRGVEGVLEYLKTFKDISQAVVTLAPPPSQTYGLGDFRTSFPNALFPIIAITRLGVTPDWLRDDVWAAEKAGNEYIRHLACTIRKAMSDATETEEEKELDPFSDALTAAKPLNCEDKVEPKSLFEALREMKTLDPRTLSAPSVLYAFQVFHEVLRWVAPHSFIPELIASAASAEGGAVEEGKAPPSDPKKPTSFIPPEVLVKIEEKNPGGGELKVTLKVEEEVPVQDTEGQTGTNTQPEGANTEPTKAQEQELEEKQKQKTDDNEKIQAATEEELAAEKAEVQDLVDKMLANMEVFKDNGSQDAFVAATMVLAYDTVFSPYAEKLASKAAEGEGGDKTGGGEEAEEE